MSTKPLPYSSALPIIAALSVVCWALVWGMLYPVSLLLL